jgi:hypothetical protein
VTTFKRTDIRVLDRIIAILAIAAAIALVVYAFGCGGGGRKRPQQPGAAIIPVSTQWGSLSVSWACPGAVFDRASVEQDVARAYLRAAQQRSGVAGLSLTDTWAFFGGETDPDLHGHHEWTPSRTGRPELGSSRIYLHCPPRASALAHEIQHRMAHQLGLRCDGSPDGGLHLIDHPAGWDLACRRLPG